MGRLRGVDDGDGRRRGEIPVIDMAGVDGPERQRIAGEIAEACETWGFFQVLNHGFDESLMQRAKEVSRQFFALPEEEKLKCQATPGNNQGYNHSKLKLGKFSEATAFLLNVFLTDFPIFTERYPHNPPAYRVVMAEYVKEARALQEKILGLLSEMLGLEKGALKKRLGGPSGVPSHPIRINHYLPNDGLESSEILPAHSDASALTMLLADDVPGLEVKKDDEWILVTPIANALIFNIADQTEILSNGRYKSVEHRGMPHPTQERLTLACFYGPNDEAVIGPMEELIDDVHPALCKTHKYGDFFATFVKEGLIGKGHVNASRLDVEPV